MWEIIGYEYSYDEEGKEKGVTLYATKEMKLGSGVKGKKAKRYWYRPDCMTYRPSVGDKVHLEVEVRGKYEILVDIYK